MISKMTKYDEYQNPVYMEVRVEGSDIKDLIQNGIRCARGEFSQSEWILIQGDEDMNVGGTVLNVSKDGYTLVLKYAEGLGQ